MMLRQLEYLVALAREEHFGRAAQSCHVSQPALSAGLRKLEAGLGVQIVRRGQRFAGFTREGTEVLRWAQRVLTGEEVLKQTLSSMSSGLAGELRIGAIPTALTVASLFTTPVRREHPAVTFSLRSMSSREIVTRINDFDIDAGMTYVDGEPLGKVFSVPLYRERYLFLTPCDGPFGDRDSITWAEAAKAPLCLLTPEMQNRRILDGFFAEEGAEIHPALETDTTSSIYAHVTAMGLSSVIPHAWLHILGVPDGTRAIWLPQPTRGFTVGLVIASRDPASLLIRSFVDCAREVDVQKVVAGAVRRLVTTPAPGQRDN